MYTFLLLVVLESADATDTDSDWLGWEGSLYWYTLAAASMVPVSNKNKTKKKLLCILYRFAVLIISETQLLFGQQLKSSIYTGTT